MELIIASLSGLVAGAVIVYFIQRTRLTREILTMQTDRIEEMVALKEDLKVSEARLDELRLQVHEREEELRRVREKVELVENERVQALTRLEASENNLKEQMQLLETMKKEMKDTFTSLSAAALKSSSEDFLRLAREHLSSIVTETNGRLGEHRAAIDGLIKPLQESLKRYDGEIQDMEARRRQDYGGLNEQIRLLMMTHQQLQLETRRLVTALRKPQVSGRWGQFSLRRVAELAGMAPYCDYYEEHSVSTDDGRLRPDMIVKLPNNRVIVVDAKAPVDAYLNAVSGGREEDRKAAIENYVGQIRAHMNSLSSKAYWDQFESSPEFVVMYLPGESFFSAAVEHDPKLIEDGSLKRVIIATPTTFIALLKAVAYGWQQAELTKNAEEVSRLGRELYERFAVAMEHFSRTGFHLKKAVETYNESVRSIETRLLHSVRRFKGLGISSKKRLDEIEEIDVRPKKLDADAIE